MADNKKIIPCQFIKENINGNVVFCLYIDLLVSKKLNDSNIILTKTNDVFTFDMYENMNKHNPDSIYLVLATNHPDYKLNNDLINLINKKNYNNLFLKKNYFKYNLCFKTENGEITLDKFKFDLLKKKYQLKYKQ